MALEALSGMASLDEVIEKVNELVAHINALNSGKKPTEKIPDGCVTKGKYKGQPLDDIVRNDPWYIQWMQRQDIDPQSFGFSLQQIADALADTRPEPARRR